MFVLMPSSQRTDTDPKSRQGKNGRKKSLKVNVSSTAALARVLDKMSLEYKILSDNDANIYARPGISELVTALDKEGCKLNSCSEQEETLEGFFISLVGGGSNE